MRLQTVFLTIAQSIAKWRQVQQRKAKQSGAKQEKETGSTREWRYARAALCEIYLCLISDNLSIITSPITITKKVLVFHYWHQQ